MNVPLWLASCPRAGPDARAQRRRCTFLACLAAAIPIRTHRTPLALIVILVMPLITRPHSC